MGNSSSKNRLGPAIRLRQGAPVKINSVFISTSQHSNYLVGTVSEPFDDSTTTSSSSLLADIGWKKPDGSFTELIMDENAFCWLKLPGDSLLRAQFNFILDSDVEKRVEEMFFVNANSDQELERLFYEFINEHTSDKSVCENKPSVYKVNRLSDKNSTWSWSWEPPEHKDFDHGGWWNHAAFFGREKNNAQFQRLISFKYWVQDIYFHADVAPPSPINETSYNPVLIPAQFLGESMSDEYESQEMSKKESSLCSQEEIDDGPLFRATLASLEKKTVLLKKSVKTLMQSFKQLNGARRSLTDSYGRLMETMYDLKSRNPALFDSDIVQYLLGSLNVFIKMNHQQLRIVQDVIVNPLENIYYNQIKTADIRRRNFDEASKDFYQFLSKYLSSRNDPKDKEAKQDQKYLSRKKEFDYERFQYYNFIFELNGGRKEKDILFQLTDYAQVRVQILNKLCSEIQLLKPDLAEIARISEETKSEISLLRGQDREKHRQLRSMALLNRTSSITSRELRAINTDVPFAVSKLPGDIRNISSPEAIRHIENSSSAEDPSQRRHKEGILFALSKPSIINDPVTLPKLWHKYWIVLSDGKLSEYDNWKATPDLHNEPINLKMATVREARNVDRRFCFEVITPHLKRVYQTTSEEDLNAWITAIQSAVGESLSVDSPFNQVEQLEQNNQQTKPLVEALGIKRMSSMKPSSSDRPPVSNDAVKTRDDDHDGLTFLKTLRTIDSSNSICADCSSTESVEWCATNFPVLLCIECSGVHRSLGSHQSRIRSLALDTSAFNPDMREVMRITGNAMLNQIYESTLQEDSDIQSKPTAKTPHEQKSHFIAAKYIQRKFVKPPEQSLNDLMFKAVEQDDVQLLIYCLACRGDPDACDLENVPLIFRALEKPRSLSKQLVYPLAELLLVNGAHLPEPDFVHERLSEDAIEYLRRRSSRMSRNAETEQSTLTAVPTAAASSSSSGAAASDFATAPAQTIDAQKSGRGAKLVKKMSIHRAASSNEPKQMV